MANVQNALNLTGGIAGMISSNIGAYKNVNPLTGVNEAQSDIMNLGNPFYSIGSTDLIMNLIDAASGNKTFFSGKDFYDPSRKQRWGQMIGSGLEGVGAGYTLGSAINDMTGYLMAEGGPVHTFDVGGYADLMATIGGVTNVISNAIGNAVLQNKADRMANRMNAAVPYAMLANNNQLTNVVQDSALLQQDGMFAALKAFGGPMGTTWDTFDNGIRIINKGGTHEENPNNGVPQGIAPDGQPNLVEEGEVIYDNYVFSKRLKLDKDLAKEVFNLNGEMSFADAAYELQKESSERPNDEISKRGLQDMMYKLQAIQEDLKMQKQERELREQLANMSPEEAEMFMQQLMAGGEGQQFEKGGFLNKLAGKVKNSLNYLANLYNATKEYFSPSVVENPQTVLDFAINRLARVENSKLNPKGGYDIESGLWKPYRGENEPFDSVGWGIMLNPETHPEAVSLVEEQGGLTDEQMRNYVWLIIQDDYLPGAKAAYEKHVKDTFGKDVLFEDLSPWKQSLLLDYQYNVGLKKFPKFMSAVYNDDREGMLAEYERYANGKKLTDRNNVIKDEIELNMPVDNQVKANGGHLFAVGDNLLLYDPITLNLPEMLDIAYENLPMSYLVTHQPRLSMYPLKLELEVVPETDTTTKTKNGPNYFNEALRAAPLFYDTAAVLAQMFNEPYNKEYDRAINASRAIPKIGTPTFTDYYSPQLFSTLAAINPVLMLSSALLNAARNAGGSRAAVMANLMALNRNSNDAVGQALLLASNLNNQLLQQSYTTRQLNAAEATRNYLAAASLNAENAKLYPQMLAQMAQPKTQEYNAATTVDFSNLVNNLGAYAKEKELIKRLSSMRGNLYDYWNNYLGQQNITE